MINKISTISLVSLFLFFNLNAQSSYTISGIIQEKPGNTFAFANVLLLRSTDSTLVKGTLSQEDGNYKIENINSGNYFVQSTMIGYQSAYSKPFVLNDNFTVENLILSEGEALDEVTVVAKKPLYQQKIDRMVINVENSIVSAGGTALEVLERSPGVLVNRGASNSSISLQGKNGVVVMINGKISYMPESSLVDLLDGMSADNIESIELITTPPANLDAEGNAGYINIVLKKSTDIGLNGSYSIATGYGNGPTNNDNISFNYRKNKVNLFGNYSFLLDKQPQEFIFSKEFMENGSRYSTYTVSDRDKTQRNHNVRLGLDMQLSEKTIMGFLFNAFDNRWSMHAINNGYDAENSIPYSYVILDNSEINHKKHFGINYNFKHNFNDDKFISFNIDYLNYDFINPTNYTITFFDKNKDLISEEMLFSGKLTPLKTWVSSLDYSNTINEKIKFDLGAKGTITKFNNDVTVENFIDGNWVTDPDLTNISILNEKIFATYGSLDYTIDDKTKISAGLRYEYTDSKLDTDTEGTVVDKTYGLWFPSIFLNRNINDNFSMNLSYSKRITRPTFNDLAPFIIFIDPYTFITGNSSLQPAISNSIKYNLNYKSYFLSFQYTNEDSSILRFQPTFDETTGRIIYQSENIDYTKTFGITFGFPLKISNWWRTQNNLNYNYQKLKSFYLKDPIVNSMGSFTANSTHSFKLSDSFSAELSGNYIGSTLDGYGKNNETYSFNFGLQKNLKDDWGTLKFSINDILDSYKWTGGVNLPEQNLKTYNSFDFSNRTFVLTYSRNFGNKKLKSARERETGSEEERKRVE